MDTVCLEVDEMLQENGTVTIGELTKQLILPGDFITKLITSRIGTIIRGRIEQDTLFTEAFVLREQAKLRGIISAITKPTPMSEVQQQFQESLFDPMTKDLSKQKRLFGQIHKSTTGSLYVPKLFEGALQSSIGQFLSQNGYISYDRVESMLYISTGNNSAKNYMKTKFPNTFTINNYCISEHLRDQLDGSIENCIINVTPMNLHQLNIIPSEFDQDDVKSLLSNCPSMTKYRQNNQDPIIVFDASYVLTMTHINNIVNSFKQMAIDNVSQVLSSKSKSKKNLKKPVSLEVKKNDKKFKKKKNFENEDEDDEIDEDDHDRMEKKTTRTFNFNKITKF